MRLIKEEFPPEPKNGGLKPSQMWADASKGPSPISPKLSEATESPGVGEMKII